MANTEKDRNGSQFFLTLAATPELEGRNTLFGRVVGDTIFNVVKMAEGELVEGTERLLYPTRVVGAEVLVNPFEGMERREIFAKKSGAEGKDEKAKKKTKKKGGKGLLSFAEGEEGEDTGMVLKKETFNSKLVSASADETKSPPDKSREEVPRINGHTNKNISSKTDDQPKSKAARQKTTRSPSPTAPPPQPPDPSTQLPPRDPESPSRSPSPTISPKLQSTQLSRTNAEIAALKASMKRTVPSAPPPSQKKSALEQMIPETATRGRKRKYGAISAESATDGQSMRLLEAFRARLEGAAAANPTDPVASKVSTVGNDGDLQGHLSGNGTVNGNASGKENDEDDEAELCDLHFIAHCQSCQSWDSALPSDAGAEEEDAKDWMSHTLNFEKDRLGKDLSWKRKGEEELVVIDPLAKAREMREGEREKKRGKGGGGRAWDRGRG